MASTDFPAKYESGMDEPMGDPSVLDPQREAQKFEEQLQAFGYSLAHQRDEWVRARRASGWDRRVQEDIDQYHARDAAAKQASEMMQSVEAGYPVTTQGAKPNRSTVFIGLTRQKTNAAEARLSDIMLPTDDRNFGIAPTPIPELASSLGSDAVAQDPKTGQQLQDANGQPVTEKAVARKIMELAREKSDAMQEVIDDQLIECDYNSESRKAIHDAAVMGTGILKGPIVTNRTRRAWMPITDETGQTVQCIEIVEEINPASFRVDPRNVWEDPACGDDIHTGKGIYERDLMTARQVRDLAKQPKYMREQLRKVLEEGPKPTATMLDPGDETSRERQRTNYEVWTYTGEVNHDDLEAAGVPVGEKDELRSISGVVVFINATVVKAYLNPLESGDLPYDFYPWEKVSDSPRGYGIPYLMRSQQKVLNAAWRTMMDNMGVSSGPQIVIKPSVIQPADKQMQLTGRKIWYATDDTDDVRKAFTTFEFASHQAELEKIIGMAQQLADEETGVPMLTQGEQGKAPDTVGGMQMLMNAANVVLRRLVKQYDDYITKPHIRRYYDYNMLYSDKDNIKGDFNIDARGSSALLIRDIQNQAFMNLMAAASNPVFGPMVDPKKLFEKALQAQHVDPADIMLSDDEIEKKQEAAAQAAQQGGGDPRLVAAKMKGEAEMQRAQADIQISQAEAQTRMQLAQQDQAFKLQMLDKNIQLEILKLAQTKELTLEQIKASLAETAISERTKKELLAAETQLKMASGSGV